MPVTYAGPRTAAAAGRVGAWLSTTSPSTPSRAKTPRSALTRARPSSWSTWPPSAGSPPSTRGSSDCRRPTATGASRSSASPATSSWARSPARPRRSQTFCSATYGVTFPLIEKIDVNGDDRHPIYAELTEVADAEGDAGDITGTSRSSSCPDGSVAALPAPGRARGPGTGGGHRGITLLGQAGDLSHVGRAQSVARPERVLACWLVTRHCAST